MCLDFIHEMIVKICSLLWSKHFTKSRAELSKVLYTFPFFFVQNIPFTFTEGAESAETEAAHDCLVPSWSCPPLTQVDFSCKHGDQ